MSAAEILKSSPQGAAMTIAENTVEARDAGRISEFTVNVVMEGLAKRFHNGNMAALLADEVGKVFLRPRNNRVSAAENYEIAKREGWFNKDGPVPHARRAQPHDTDTDTDDDGDDETFDQKVERLMRDKNISRDAAISILHRAEKVAKGISV